MHINILSASEVSANLYCNSLTSVLGRLRDYLRLLMKRSVTDAVYSLNNWGHEVQTQKLKCQIAQIMVKALFINKMINH